MSKLSIIFKEWRVTRTFSYTDSVSEKCEGFCKKNKQVLCDDLSLNRELIDTNVKEDLNNYEIVELKKIVAI